MAAISPCLKGTTSPSILKSSPSYQSLHSPGLSFSTSSIPSSPPLPAHFNNDYYIKVITALFSKYSNLKELEHGSNEILNELITNIEWKWDPEFQFPQLFRAAQNQLQQQQSQQSSSHPKSPNHVVSSANIKKSPNNQSPVGSSPALSSSHSPKRGNESPKMVKSISSSSSTSSSSTSQKPFIPPLSFDKAAVTKSTQQTPPISPGGKIQQQQQQPINVTNQMLPLSQSSVSIPATTGQKVVVKKNPVFGKLLTRKDSSISKRQYFLYAIGGEHSEGTVEVYDIQSNRWKFVSQMPVPTSEFASFYDSQNSIYCIGGKSTPYQVSKYNTEKDSWEQLSLKLKTPRVGHCAVFDGRRFVYLVGGEGSSAAKLLERLDIVTMQMTTLQPMKYGRRHFNCFFDGNKLIYAVDGYSSKDQESTIEVYDIETDKWSVLTTIQTPRYMASVSYDGSRYIAISGGINRCTAHDVQHIERFDTQQQTWERLDEKFFTNQSAAASSNQSAPQSPTLQATSSLSKNRLQLYNSTVFDGEQFIYYCGLGVDESRPLLYRYNIRTKKFDKLASLQHMRLTNQLVLISK
ncbi:RING zinc finger-containing protein [Cavenderia fasciculata]|uniref:RING zinc finger-containing protein n=1 Tax=Cavenderia fasciculata TaxID=261658 RepID=F4QF60_CACFS|nr:RING zinc finger-containing protein [Cavenderia fasciculata]EGG14214.1 RING zinc finger-containing protein [Cavenderia fasciculata]|eukprot:XP_004350922.1 RING zinc finger-containing protein [Cavenderia fasciculata]